MPPQAARLLLLTAGIAGFYMVARHVLTPKSFGQYGWFRGAAIQEIAARQPLYPGQSECEKCHAPQQAAVAKGPHKTMACAACHGPVPEHRQDPKTKTGKLDDNLCLRCHRADPARPAWHKQINVDDHFTGNNCCECHKPHQPNETQ